MKGDLYRRWLIEGRDLTLEEFVAERRVLLRQQRAQRHLAAQYRPLLQQSAFWEPQLDNLQRQQAMLWNDPRALYRGHSLHGLRAILSSLPGGLFR